MVVIDATTLLRFLQPGTPGPTDAEEKPLRHARERVKTDLFAEGEVTP